jgi:hypothetical protein
MRSAGLLVAFALAGCATSGSSGYECPQVTPSSGDIEQLKAAAAKAGALHVDLHSLSYCRQRGDGNLYATWGVSREDENGDGAHHWDDVACANEARSNSGWSCNVTRVRAVRLSMPDSRHLSMVTLPTAMGVDEGRRLSNHGLAQWPSLAEVNACGWNRDPAEALRHFRETAAKDGIWNLEPQPQAGRFRLERETYYFDFNDPSAAAQSTNATCWGVLEFLE